MTVRVTCPCGRQLTLADHLQGKHIRCPECTAVIAVPEAVISPPDNAPRVESKRSAESKAPNKPATASRPAQIPQAKSSRPAAGDPSRKRPRPAANEQYEEPGDGVDWTSLPPAEDPYGAAPLPPRRSRPNKPAQSSRSTVSRTGGTSGFPFGRTVLITAVAFVIPLLIGLGKALIRSAGGGTSVAAIPDVSTVQVPASIFPARPQFQPSFPSGVQLARTRLTGSGPGEQTQLNLYLPGGEHAAGSLGCVLVAPAGTNLLIGNSLDGDDYHDETLPYAEAGYMTVQYSLDGAIADMETATDPMMKAAYQDFRAAGAGTLNTRCVIEFVKARFPEVNPARIFTAGHSSAGTLSLLAAEYFSDVAGCIAYAPCSDVQAFHQEIYGVPGIGGVFPEIQEFDRQFSPVLHVQNLKCPLFVFQAQDDSVVAAAETKSFVDQARRSNSRVEYVEVNGGEHYDSMIREGIPRAIQWLRTTDK